LLDLADALPDFADAWLEGIFGVLEDFPFLLDLPEKMGWRLVGECEGLMVVGAGVAGNKPNRGDG